MKSLQDWNDFPKGLRIIILDEDPQAAAYAKSKLESFQYVDAKVLYGTDELQWLPDTVSSFSSETDALDALSRESGAFHLALVDASSGNGNGGFRFLEAAHDLPTVMMSSKTCLNTMMKSIALGAVEFLQKPVAEDKLKNIWQHVVYKAFTARDVTISDSLKPVRESIISMIQLNSETSSEAQTRRSTSMEEESEVHAKSETQLCISEQQTHSSRTDTNERSSSDKFDAPSTPQQEQQHGNSNSACHREKSPSPRSKRRIEFEVGTCQAAASCNNGEGKQVQQIETEAAAVSDRSSQGNSLQCVKREDQDHDHGEGTSSQVKPTSLLRHQSVDLTCEHLPNAISSSSTSLYARAEEEVSSAEDPKSNEVCWGKDTTFSPHNCNEENMDSATRDVKEGSRNPNHADKKLNSTSTKKKLKVEWTADLHKRFVQAVEQLGVDQAIPSKILEIMKVDGLTRHNVASHLQKYRAHRRHVSAREDAAARKLWQRYDGSWSYHGIRAAAKALPIGTPVRQPLYVWGCPATIEHGGTSMWQQFPVTNPPVWPPQNGSTWNHSAGIAAEAWGCPSYRMLPHQTNLPVRNSEFIKQHLAIINSSQESLYHPYLGQKLPLSSNSSMGRGFSTQIEVKSKSSEGHPAAEAIDVAIKEALKNPWSPLPIGLIPPSLESVITELQKQGIDKLPPPVHP